MTYRVMKFIAIMTPILAFLFLYSDRQILVQLGTDLGAILLVMGIVGYATLIWAMTMQIHARKVK